LLVSAVMAIALTCLLVRDPAHVAAAVGNHDYATLALSVVGQFAGWLRTILRFL
jgi:hypothetical protein